MSYEECMLSTELLDCKVTIKGRNKRAENQSNTIFAPLLVHIMQQKPAIPKGTRDFLPLVTLRREYIFNTIRRVFEKYGFAPIETPSMELLSVLTGKYGEEGDRLIFKILNSGDYLEGVPAELFNDAKKLSFQIAEKALRYDLTVPFARFVVMHQNELTFPFKRYQIQPVWRADRPQKGRYREFYQCDADVVGSDSLLFEAEFICIFDEVLSTLGLKDFTILVNNRKVLSGYAEVIGKAEKFNDVCIAIDKLDKIGREGVAKELAERGIVQEEADTLFDMITFQGSLEEKLAFLSDKFSASPTGAKGIAELQRVFELHKHLSRYNAKIDFNLQLARGLHYYTGTIYEVKANNVQIGSICGGGRYDNLTGVFGVPGLSGVGISFGADRIYDVLNELNLFPTDKDSLTRVMLANFGEESLGPALKLLDALRQAGIPAEIYPDSAKLKKQIAYADKKGIPYLLLAGEAEIDKGEYQLKNLVSGEQTTLSLEELIGILSVGQP